MDVDISATVQQQLNHYLLAGFRRKMQRRPFILIMDFYIRTLIQCPFYICKCCCFPKRFTQKGEEAIKHGIPLYVAQHQEMSADARGNQILLGKGARELPQSGSSGKVDLTEVFKSMEEEGIPQSSSGRQGEFELHPMAPK